MNHFTDRRYVFAVAIILVGLIFVIRLFHIQVIDKSYEQYALSNAQSVRVIYPARGLIYDRNGDIMVYNKAAYDIMLTPRQLEAFDTTELCRILQISREDAIGRIQTARTYSYRVPSVFMKQANDADFMFLVGSCDNPFKDLFSATFIKLSNHKQKTHC